MRPQTTRSVGMEPNHELEFTCGVRPVREALELPIGLTHRRAAKVASETAQNTSASSRVRVLSNHHHV